MLRSALASSISLLAIALANPLLTANADETGLEHFWCEAKGTTTFTDGPGDQPATEKVDVRLMATVDEANRNARIREPVDEDTWDPWGPWGAAIFDGEGVQLYQKILHTTTEVTIFRKSGKFYFLTSQSREFPKFLVTAQGTCVRY